MFQCRAADAIQPPSLDSMSDSRLIVRWPPSWSP